MNALPNFPFLELSSILLQSTGVSFRMNMILCLAVAVFFTAIIVLIYVYSVLQIVLGASGLKGTDRSLTVDWIQYLYGLTLGLVLTSLYIYSQLT